MGTNMIESRKSPKSSKQTLRSGERGSAIIIALFVLALMSLFVVYALSRTSTEASAVGNEASEARTLYAAQGGLEKMTRDFNKIFERKLNPSTADLATIEAGEISVPTLSRQVGGGFDFDHEMPLQISPESNIVLGGGPYAGLTAIRDTWRLRTTATDGPGSQIMLTRNILNNRIPIFQFGIFYDDDLELFNGPNFRFGGRVHSNRHFFLHPSNNGAFFDSRVTARGYIVTQTKKNGDLPNLITANIQVRDADNVFQVLAPNEGSVLNGAPNVFAVAPFIDASLPSSARNPNWDTIDDRFDGNIVSEAPELRLPMKVNSNTDLIELIHRGKSVGDLHLNSAGVVEAVTAATADDSITTSERYANKTGIRISLSNTKASLPGCVGVAGLCGVRLDGHSDGLGGNPVAANDVADPTRTERSRGYRPQAMVGGYQATRVNGERLFTGGIIPGTLDERQVWIKVETVATRASDGAIITTDITRDILSLGLTEQAPSNASFQLANYNNTVTNNAPGGPLGNTAATAPPVGTDSRSIIKLQRFVIPGAEIPRTAGGPTFALLSYSAANGGYNTVVRYRNVDATDLTLACAGGSSCTAENIDPNFNLERFGHLKRGMVDGQADRAVVPFPIKMFDAREGFHFDLRGDATYYADSTRLTRNGAMSMIDIDMANLRRFLRGDFDNLFPNNPTVRNTIPQENGWVVYVSDRRGDNNFDGELDMEDVYGAGQGNDGTIQPGEDLDGAGRFGTGILDGGAFPTETDRYQDNTLIPDRAAVTEQRFYRRGVRLINGSVLPGVYDSADPDNTRGFTLASENGVYVLGNYNATGAAAPPAFANTPFNQYFPLNGPTHIPASVVGDAVTVLSNNWNDGASFRTAAVAPWGLGGRTATETTIRFAMIAGDTVTSQRTLPHQGGSINGGVYTDARGNGGVHNFKRFLENWSGVRLNYSGSLINLYNSRNNNGTYKCCVNVYGAPNRNWVFDSTFLNPDRIPPGTPFFQYVQTTGFERSTE